MKKITLALLTLVCALCCALGLAACGDNDGDSGETVTCKLMPGANFVERIDVRQDGKDGTNILTVLENSNEALGGFEKGVECTVTVTMKYGYDLGGLYVYISSDSNDELALTRCVDEDKKDTTEDKVYGTCTFTPTNDFNVLLMANSVVLERTWMRTELEEMGETDVSIPLGYTGQLGAVVEVGPNFESRSGMMLSAESANADVATARAWRPYPEDMPGFWTVEITALGLGTTTVTLTAEGYNLSTETFSFDVTVTEPEHVESLTLSTEMLVFDLELDYGRSTGVRIYTSAQNVPVNIWIEDPDIVTTNLSYGGDEDGYSLYVFPVGAGTTTVKVTIGDKTASCEVTVMAAPERVSGSVGLEFRLEIWNSYTEAYNLYGLGSCTDTHVIIPNYYDGLRVAMVGVYDAQYNDTVTDITISDGINTIGSSGFSNFYALRSVKIPRSITKISTRAFDYCRELASITYGGTIAEWDSIKKGQDWDRFTGDYTIICIDGTIAKDGTITRN